jgi:hypothetical protein
MAGRTVPATTRATRQDQLVSDSVSTQGRLGGALAGRDGHRRRPSLSSAVSLFKVYGREPLPRRPENGSDSSQRSRIGNRQIRVRQVVSPGVGVAVQPSPTNRDSGHRPTVTLGVAICPGALRKPCSVTSDRDSEAGMIGRLGWPTRLAYSTSSVDAPGGDPCSLSDVR